MSSDSPAVITMAEVNSTQFKNDYKAFRDLLNSNATRFNDLTSKYVKISNVNSAIGWLLGSATGILTFIQSISSSIVSTAQLNNQVSHN